MNKVQNGTRQDGPALCKSCRYATVMASASNNRELTYCGNISRYIHEKITECSAYEDKSKPTVYQMEKVAWILSTKRSGDIGFITGAEYKERFKTHTALPDDYQ